MPDTPVLMRQAVLREPRRIDLVSRAIPEPGPGEVLLRIRAALTCGTDLKTYRRGHPRLPFGPFGHECAGDVAATGSGVRAVREGDEVVPTPTAPCNACPSCRAGRENLCERLFEGIVLGAYADYLLVSSKVAATNLFRKPAHLSYIEAAFLEPLACVVHGWARLGPAPVEQVAVVGLGAIGLLHIALARSRGARVTAVGRRPERLALARRLGADATADTAALDTPGVHDGDRDIGQAIRDVSGGAGPDLVIECTGQEQMWTQAPAWTRRGGRVLLFAGLPGGTRAAFDATRLHYDEIDIVHSFHYRPPDVAEALRLLADGRIGVRPIVSGVRDLAAIAAIFAALDRGEGVKYAILPEDAGWV